MMFILTYQVAWSGAFVASAPVSGIWLAVEFVDCVPVSDTPVWPVVCALKSFICSQKVTLRSMLQLIKSSKEP